MVGTISSIASGVGMIQSPKPGDKPAALRPGGMLKGLALFFPYLDNVYLLVCLESLEAS